MIEDGIKKDYQLQIAIPYIDFFMENIKRHFSDKAVKLLTAMSVFNPAQLLAEESLSSNGLQEISDLADFYGNEASVEYLDMTYTSPPLLDREELLSKWRRAFYKEKQHIVNSKKLP